LNGAKTNHNLNEEIIMRANCFNPANQFIRANNAMNNGGGSVNLMANLAKEKLLNTGDVNGTFNSR